MCGVSGKPARSKYVGNREEAGEEITGWNLAGRNERTIGERDSRVWRLCSRHEFKMLASGLVSGTTVRTSVVRDTKGSDDELSGFDSLDCTANFLDYPAVFVSHGHWLLDFLNAAIGPQIRAANACDRESNDCIGGVENFGIGLVFEANIPRSI